MAELRTAQAADIPRLVEIRAAVRENRLRDFTIGPEDYCPYVKDGRCWVWDEDGTVQGFAAIDVDSANLWALFVAPGAERRGIGRALHRHTVEEARRRGLPRLTLQTDRGTRAEHFYHAAGWQTVDWDRRGTANMALEL